MILTRTGRWVTYLLIAVFSIPLLLPLFWIVSVAFRGNSEVYTIPLQLLPSELTLVAFQNVFANPDMLRLFLNSYVISFSTMAIALVLASLAAYGFARFRIRGGAGMLVYILMTQMVPLVLLALPYFLVITRIGLYDTWGALIIANVSFALPFAILMLRDFVRSLPLEIDEAAKIDGAGAYRTFYSIILPNLRPGLIATGVYAFILAWNEFLFGVVLTDSVGARPLTVGIATLKGEFQTFWNEIMALSILGSVPLIILFFFIQRQFIAGMTAGSVK